MGIWKWKNNWGRDDLPEDPKSNSQDDEWEKWRREVDRPSPWLVYGVLLMVPFVWLWWARWYVLAALGIGLMFQVFYWVSGLM